MKTAAIVIDSWKLATFSKHLSQAGYKFTEHTGLTAGTLTLRVAYEWVAKLQPVVEAANAECSKLKTEKTGDNNGS